MGNVTGKREFEAVVVDHGPTALGLCQAVVGSNDVDDAWSETFLSAERDDDLAEALHRLPHKQKQAVAYHYLAGVPYADVARRAAADGIAALRRAYPVWENHRE
jgi:DNA-directed RNA polymerase specialized sigma24 family protein